MPDTNGDPGEYYESRSSKQRRPRNRRRDRLAHTDGDKLQLVTTRSRALGEHRDVASIGVDVQVVGVEMPEPDPQAASSQ